MDSIAVSQPVGAKPLCQPLTPHGPGCTCSKARQDTITDYYISVGQNTVLAKRGVTNARHWAFTTPWVRSTRSHLQTFMVRVPYRWNYPMPGMLQSGSLGNGIWLHNALVNMHAPSVNQWLRRARNPDLRGLMTKLQARPHPVIELRLVQWVPAQTCRPTLPNLKPYSAHGAPPTSVVMLRLCRVNAFNSAYA